MTRSLGDYVAQTVGVSCIPEIIQYPITSDDKILILASDGVWEFLQNKDIIKLIIPFYLNNDIENACNVLL